MKLIELEMLLSQRLGVRSGKNKIAECLRLLVEIARKENKTAPEVLEETLNETGLAQKALWPFTELKKALLKRRFPLTKNIDLSSTLLHEVNGETDPIKRTHIKKLDPSHLYIQETSIKTPLVKRAKTLFPEAPHTLFKDLKSLYRSQGLTWKDMGKTRLIFSDEPYDFLEQCPCTKKALLCNYYVIKLGMGCPFDCSYCYLQEYQNLKGIILPTNPEKFLDELSLFLKQHPNKFLRIGTGEYTDSLALDHITEYSKTFVPFFRDKNVFFELKTKSDNISNLLDLDHGGKTVISWSMNPSNFALTEEWDAAPVEQRLKAAQHCQEAGYPIGIHFDPIVEFEGWECAYKELVEQIYSALKPPLKWMSLGTLRFAPHMKPAAEKRHPDSRIFLGELFVDPMDKKMRYPEERRVFMYQTLLQTIRKYDLKVPIYLCMESHEVWKKVFSKLPFSGRMDYWICQ